MYYEFNVSNKDGHVFATHPRSVTTFEQAEDLFEILETKFPLHQGYKITCERKEESWTKIPPFCSEPPEKT